MCDRENRILKMVYGSQAETWKHTLFRIEVAVNM